MEEEIIGMDIEEDGSLSTFRPKLTFIGTGYLGATYAVCYAELGYDVLGIDVDSSKIDQLNSGRVPFREPGLDELLVKNLASGRLRFSTSYEEAAEFGDVHFICVSTPQSSKGPAADLSYVEASVAELSKSLTRDALIVGKSTVPVGTAEWVESLVKRHADPDLKVAVGWSPEFLQEGFAVNDVLRPNRIVMSAHTEWGRSLLMAAHKGVFDLAKTEDRDVPVIDTDFATAELAKHAANTFLANKISFMNAMAEVCEASGGDVVDLARALGYDDRIGRRFLQAGVGFGGACLPKDIRAFQARANELGVGEALRFVHEVDQINLRRRHRVFRLTAELLGRQWRTAGPDLSGARVAILGATFKPHTDDVRDSPALAVAEMLISAGAEVYIFDPEGMDNARRIVPKAAYAQSLTEAVSNAEAVCVLTEWPEFRNADPVALGAAVKVKHVIDGRNCLDVEAWRSAGWTLRALGRPGVQ